MGKTRLALQVAEELEGPLAEDLLFVELAPVADPGALPMSVAMAIGVREEAESPSRDVVEALISRLSMRPALLVLDNCEHLVEAVALLAWRLLEACPELRVLATSRQRLGLTGEVVWRVPSLPVPDPGQMPAVAEGAREYALRYPAVQLFVERAGAIRPGFQLIGRAQALAVAQICRRLDGIPLAIELAAARVMTLTAEQIAARLDDRFRLLTGGSRAALPRQRTLQALIDWSYDLLPEAERALLRRLSVFAGGWSLEAAEWLIQDDGVGGRCADALDLLTGLVEKSLVIYEPHGGAKGAGGTLWGPVTGRYQMLETVREYAREKLRASGEEAVARRRHAEFFLRVAEQARGVEAGPREEEALVHLERERDNMRAAITWSQSSAGELELGLQLGVALGWFWSTRGYFTEGREHLARLLEADTGRATGIMRARAWAFAVAAELALLQGDTQSARPLLENSLSLARATDDRPLIARSLRQMGYLERDPRVSRALYEESLAIYRELGDRHQIAALLVSLGMTYTGTDLVRARALYEEGLAVFRQLDSKSSIAWTLVHLHNLTSWQGDYAAARGHAEESLALFRALGHRMGIGCSLNQLGRVAFHEGDLDEACSLHEQGLQIARELGSQQDVAATLSTLGDVALAQQDPAAAAAYYEQALRIFRETDDWTNSWMTLIGLGRLAEQQGDEARAEALFRESLATGQKQDQAVIVVVSIEALGRVAARKGDPLGARLLAAAAAQRETIGTPVPPVERPGHESALAAVRAAMGEPAFTAAWAAGASLTLEQAAAEALGRRSPHGG